MINITINGDAVQAEENDTILKAAERVGISIPTLCYLKELAPEGACRMCMVEIEGSDKLVTACSTQVREGMSVLIKSPRVVEARRFVLDLLLSNHPANCSECAHSGICSLQDLCIEYDVDETTYPGKIQEKEIDDSNPYITYDPNLCILCHKCVNVCQNIMDNHAIETMGKGFFAQIGTAFGEKRANTCCDSCGNCVEACPTGALSFKREKEYHIWEPERKICVNCPACDEQCRGNGTACQMDVLLKNYKIVDVKGVKEGPGGGMLCEKGRFQCMDELRALVKEQIGFYYEAKFE